MSCNTENILNEIKFLKAKRIIVEREPCPRDEYITLLLRLKQQYDALATIYMDANENLLMCQALVNSANIAFDICEADSIEPYYHNLRILIDRLFKATDNFYDLDLCRSSFVALGRLYYCLGDYTLAEKYIRMAFDDYDYSVPTFRFFIKVLDVQKKYREILFLMKRYLNMSGGYHEACSIDDFNITNILQSSYASEYRNLFLDI